MLFLRYASGQTDIQSRSPQQFAPLLGANSSVQMHYTFLRSLILQCCCCYCRYYIRKAHRGSTRWILFLEGRLSVHYLFSFMNYSSRSRRQCYHATAICFSAVCDYLFFFLCESNTSGTAERICSVYMFTFTNSHGRCLCPSLGRV